MRRCGSPLSQGCLVFDFQAEQGDIVALMGPSGAGKSTLLALVAGFIEPTSGEISVAGQSLLRQRAHQRPLAMLFQEHNLFHLTVRENIGLGLHPGLKLYGSWLEVEQAAAQVGVAEYLDRLPEHIRAVGVSVLRLARCFVQPHDIWLWWALFGAWSLLRGERCLA